jgi:hypothetical protein
MNLYNNPSDQLREYERIFQNARDQYSIDKNPMHLKIQIECLKQIKYLNDRIMGQTFGE